MQCKHCDRVITFAHGFWRDDDEDPGDGFGGDASCPARGIDPMTMRALGHETDLDKWQRGLGDACHKLMRALEELEENYLATERERELIEGAIADLDAFFKREMAVDGDGFPMPEGWEAEAEAIELDG